MGLEKRIALQAIYNYILMKLKIPNLPTPIIKIHNQLESSKRKSDKPAPNDLLLCKFQHDEFFTMQTKNLTYDLPWEEDIAFIW